MNLVYGKSVEDGMQMVGGTRVVDMLSGERLPRIR